MALADQNRTLRADNKRQSEQIWDLQVQCVGIAELGQRLREHILAGVEMDNAIQLEYESGPDAPERGIGECICGWCTESRELLEPTT